MFKYPESISWTEGVFLRPHHFQQQEDSLRCSLISDRSLVISHPYGIVNIDYDEASLDRFIFRINSLHAILPCGLEVNVPENASIAPLDLSECIKQGNREITVLLAIPVSKPGEQNLSGSNSSDEVDQFSRYTSVIRNHYDENSGGNHQPIMHRRLHTRLLTGNASLEGYDTLPLCKFICEIDGFGKMTIVIDKTFTAPALALQGAPWVMNRLQPLIIHLGNIRNNLIAASRTTDSGIEQQLMQKLEKSQKLTIISGSLSILRNLASLSATPLSYMYMALSELYMELTALRPLQDFELPALYNHENCQPDFDFLIEQIYMLTASESSEWCMKINLIYDAQIDAWFGDVDPDMLTAAIDIYVGISYTSQPRKIADLVEQGDVFKVTSASQANKRIRGLRLIEERYPSPVLPSQTNILWFRAQKHTQNNTWIDIRTEGKCGIAWSKEALPDIKTDMYLILSSDKGQP
ncbi:MAG: type VI secretion system baseplate subunit TssK [Akkermansia sp.]